MTPTLLFLLCAAVCFATSDQQVEEIDSVVRTLIVKEGYHVRRYKVETEDGYLLDLFRMSHYRQNFTKEYIDSYTGKEAQDEDVYKQSVLLMPTMMSGFEEFVVGGYSQGLAFALVDVGYDVFLGNVRGSAYGQKHTKLNPDSDKEFWDYTLQDIGVKDLPAIVDKIVTLNGEYNKINYVGHMEGSTIFYIMASEKPEYNGKFNKMLTLGPIAYVDLKGAQHEMVKMIAHDILEGHNTIDADTTWDKEAARSVVGETKFKPSNEVFQKTEDLCKNEGYLWTACTSLYFLMNGYNSAHYNQTTIERAVSVIHSQMSAKQVMQYVQMFANGNFQKYDENFESSENSENVYDLSKVTTSVIIFYTPQDTWAQQEHVQKLIEKLPTVTYSQKFENLSNNMDFIYSKNIHEGVFDSVIQMLKQVVQHA